MAEVRLGSWEERRPPRVSRCCQWVSYVEFDGRRPESSPFFLVESGPRGYTLRWFVPDWTTWDGTPATRPEYVVHKWKRKLNTLLTAQEISADVVEAQGAEWERERKTAFARAGKKLERKIQERQEPAPRLRRVVDWFTEIRPWALARDATTLGDDTITFLFAPWADSPNRPRSGIPKSHPGVKYLQEEIPKRAAMEDVYLVPVSARTDFEQTDFGVGERGDQPAARGRIFLTFKRVDTPEQMRHQTQRGKRRRERNPVHVGDLVRRLRF